MSKNIWIAAGDGDLDRVKELIEKDGLSPNFPDHFTYTPMHAAASYGHLDVLEYLISHGGDVNVTDEDGDTPLYTVENVESARFLVEHGAIVDRQNTEGISPIEHLREDFPDVAEYLQTLTSTGPITTNGVTSNHPAHTPSQHQQNAASEQLTSTLMASVDDIMQRAAAEGHEPDAELFDVVSRTVLEGVMTGYEMTNQEQEEDGNASHLAKRPRTG